MILLVLILFITLAVYYIIRMRRPKNYPPGPAFVPIVGHLFILKNLGQKLKFQYSVFNHLNDVFNTKILGLQLGGELLIVVSSSEYVKEVLIRDEFQGRPDNFFIRLRSMGKRIGITSADGQEWNSQRQFVVKHLRNLGMGKESMSIHVSNELSKLMKRLPENSSPLKNILATAVINIIWTLATGSSFSDDSRIEQLIEILSARSKLFDLSGGVLNALPWLRFLMPKKVGYDMICKLNKELHALFMETISEHYNCHDQGNSENLIDVYMTEIKNGNPHFTIEQLVIVLLDLFIAGSQTTSTSIDFAIMAMIVRPDLQERLQKELDEAFDKNAPIKYSEKHRAPLAEAVLMETIRYFLIAPMMGPRRTMKQTELGPYTIPENTTLLINAQSVHHDKDYWKDPEVFRPERFLDDQGVFVSHDNFLPFALGKRRCPGEVLARNCQFTFFTEIVRNFNITLHPDSEKPNLTPVPGMLLSPHPYIPKFTPRRKDVIP